MHVVHQQAGGTHAPNEENLASSSKHLSVKGLKLDLQKIQEATYQLQLIQIYKQNLDGHT